MSRGHSLQLAARLADLLATLFQINHLLKHASARSFRYSATPSVETAPT